MAEALAVGTAMIPATATAPAVAATAGLFGSAGAFSLGSTLTTMLSLGSAGLSIASGLSQGQAIGNRGMIEDFNARQELIRGQHESNKIKENLLRTLATQNAFFGAGGIDIGSGTPVDLATETHAQADRELTIVRENANMLSAQRRLSALGLYSDQSAAQVGGFGKATLSLLDFGSRLGPR